MTTLQMFFLPLFFAATVVPDHFASNHSVPDQTEIHQLVRQLDSGRLMERDHAERQLRALGSEIEPFLPGLQELEEEYSVEVQWRLRNVRRFFQRKTLKKALGQVHFSIEKATWVHNPDRLFLTVHVNWSGLHSAQSENPIRLIRLNFPLESFLVQSTVTQTDRESETANLKPVQSSGLLEVPLTQQQKSLRLPLTFLPVSPQKEPAIDSLSLSGECHFLVATQPREFIFPFSDGINSSKVGKSTIQHQENLFIQVLSVTRSNPQEINVQVRLEFLNPHDALLSHRDWLEENRAILHNTSNESTYSLLSVRPLERTTDSFEAMFTFAVTGETALEHLVFSYKTPTVIIELRHPFLHQL